MSLLWKLPIDEEFVYESFIGTKFWHDSEQDKVGSFDTNLVPQVKGGAYLCRRSAVHRSDALRKGFVVLNSI